MNFLDGFSKNPQISNYTKICPMGEPICSTRTDRQTDVTMIIVALIILRTSLNICKRKGPVLKINAACVISTGRFLYQCPDHRRCQGTFPRMHAFYAIDLPCPARQKDRSFLHSIKSFCHIVTTCYFLYQDIQVQYQVKSRKFKVPTL